MTISNVKKQLGGVLSAGTDFARRVADAAPRTAKAAGRAAKDLGQRGLDEAKTLQKHNVQSLKDAGVSAVKAFDSQSQISGLQSGDTWKMGYGAKGSADDIGASANNSTSVTRGADGKFTVSAAGDAALGIDGEFGEGSTTDTVGVGGQCEYKFDTSADALRATKIIASIRGGIPSKDDLQFLRAHVSAIELSGAAAAELAKKANLGPLGTSRSGSAGGTLGARIELHPPSLTFKEAFTLGTKDDAGLKLGPVAAGGASEGADVKVTVERRLTFPGLDSKKVATDPALLARSVGLGVRDARDTVTYSFGAKGSALGNGAGIKGTLKFDYPADMLTRAALGDVSTVASLPDAAHVKATVQTSSSRGFAGNVGLSEDGIGAKVSLESTTTHDSTVWQYPPPGKTATVAEAVDALASLPPARKATTIKP